MLKHYLTIAFRNLLKYKVQTIISIVGLTIGFTCFSLSMLWMEYESSYDNFHSKADRIYMLRGTFDNGTFSEVAESFNSDIGFLDELKSKYPQIEEATVINRGAEGYISRGQYFSGITVSKSFFKIFDITEPGFQYDGTDSKSLIVTDKVASENFPNQEIVGEEIKMSDARGKEEKIFTVKNIVKSWPLNTNIEFEVIAPIDENERRSFSRIFILLHENVDLAAFNEALGKYDNKERFGAISYDLEVVPIKTLRQEKLNKGTSISYNSIYKFAFAGILIIFCAISNYLILLISRIRMRGRELALRKVNGATDNSFLLLFGSDVLIVLLLSLGLTLLSIHLILPSFKELSMIQMEDTSIYLNAVLYCGLVIICIMAVTLIQIHYFKKRTLREGLIKETKKDRANYFYKICVFFQLLISFGLILCTSVFIKQVNHMGNADIGFKWKNVAWINIYQHDLDLSPLVSKIEAVPHVKNVLFTGLPLWRGWSVTTFSSWEGKADDEPVAFNLMTVSHDFFDFYGITFVEGEAPDFATEEKEGDNICYINETAAKFFGWHKSVGKLIDERQVRGVFKDYLLDPRKPAEPVIFIMHNKADDRKDNLLYEYDNEIYKAETEKAVSEILREVFPGVGNHISYMEDHNKRFFTSEEALLKILKIATAVCILVSIFGIYSMVSLICTKRRKEIAIRKVNGANIQSILYSLLSEQLIVAFLAALIAFPVGYKIMKVWIEVYQKQTEISWWIFPLIFIGVLIVVIITVSTQVWRAANTNPAEVLKSE